MIQHGSCTCVFINAYSKFYQNSSICSEDIEENTFLHQSRAIPLLFINEFSPFAIPNHYSLISMSTQSVKKIGQKLLKLEPGNDIFTSIKGHNSLVYKRIQLICNPKPLLPDNGQRLLKLESRNEALTDGRTLKISKFSEGIT